MTRSVVQKSFCFLVAVGLVAVVVLFIHIGRNAARITCFSNMYNIQQAKIVWTLQQKRTNVVITSSDVSLVLGGWSNIICPSVGRNVYKCGATLADLPSCEMHGSLVGDPRRRFPEWGIIRGGATGQTSKVENE